MLAGLGHFIIHFIQLTDAHAFLPQKKTKKVIRDILNEVNQDVDDFIWETEWNAIHSTGTSVMGGYKLGSQKTKRNQFRVGLFSSTEKRIMTNSFSPWVVAEWDHEPTMAEIVEGLKQVSFFLGN